MSRTGPLLASVLMDLPHHSGLASLLHRMHPRKGCFLVFHRVADPACWSALPNREFYIDASVLGDMLDHVVAQGWCVVTMDEAAKRLESPDDFGKFVNFSIDDVYRDTVEQAVPVFRSRGLPVTLFVTTGIPDGSLVMWTAGLETIIAERAEVVLPGGAVRDCGTPAAKRALFGELCAAWEARDPEAAYREMCALNGFDPAVLHARHAVDWPMLEALRDDPCVEIGGHTVSHRRLTTLGDKELAFEVAGSRRRLQERLGVPVRHFAYPFGQAADCGPREFASARAAGYWTAATTRRGLVGPASRQAPHALPRNTLNGADRRAPQVEMHLSGLGGLLARVRG